MRIALAVLAAGVFPGVATAADDSRLRGRLDDLYRYANGLDAVYPDAVRAIAATGEAHVVQNPHAPHTLDAKRAYVEEVSAVGPLYRVLAGRLEEAGMSGDARFAREQAELWEERAAILAGAMARAEERLRRPAEREDRPDPAPTEGPPPETTGAVSPPDEFRDVRAYVVVGLTVLFLSLVAAWVGRRR